jgi:7-cyano-7-deazaguanine synthase
VSRAVVLLSGGMDSSTAAAEALADGHEVHALAIDYGQRARVELAAARRVAAALHLTDFRIVAVDLRALGGSALTDDIEVPKDRDDAAIRSGIPPTYVPARNTVFLSLALAAAEVLDAQAIYLGVNAVDYSGYPDCRPAFLAAFQQVAREGTKQGAEGRPVEICAPLVAFTKADIVTRGVELGVPFGLTLSCYEPVQKGDQALHCGHCDACHLRARGFSVAGVVDSAPHA